jgi:hypothetical protein
MTTLGFIVPSPTVENMACSTEYRESARLFLQSSVLGPPTPLPASELPPSLCFRVGRYTLACGKGGGEAPILAREQTLTSIYAI